MRPKDLPPEFSMTDGAGTVAERPVNWLVMRSLTVRNYLSGFTTGACPASVGDRARLGAVVAMRLLFGATVTFPGPRIHSSTKGTAKRSFCRRQRGIPVNRRCASAGPTTRLGE